MPTTWIALQNLYALASEKELDIDSFRANLLHCLERDKIRIRCGEFIKSRIVEMNFGKSLNQILGNISLSDEARVNLGLQLSQNQQATVHAFAGGNYYTIEQQDSIVVYSDSEDRYTYVGGEADASYLQRAWIDEKRWVILCDDLENRARREFHNVSLLRSDLHFLISSPSFKKPRPRGRKVMYFKQEIADFADRLLIGDPNISKQRFDDLVYEKLAFFGLFPEKDAYRKYYGCRYTQHATRRATAAN